MKLYGIFLSFCVLKLAIAAELQKFIPKCADFKPVPDENLEEILMGRWNVLRYYGPPMDGEEKVSCVCFIGSSTGEEHKIFTSTLMTKENGEIVNMTAIGSIIKNAVMDKTTTKEVDFSGMKVKVKDHAVHTLVYMDGDIGLIATCHENPLNKDEFFQTSEILSRNTTQPSEAFIEKAEEIIESYGISKTLFSDGSFENCQY